MDFTKEFEDLKNSFWRDKQDQWQIISELNKKVKELELKLKEVLK